MRYRVPKVGAGRFCVGWEGLFGVEHINKCWHCMLLLRVLSVRTSRPVIIGSSLENMMPTSLRQKKISLIESLSGLDPRSVVSSSHESKLNQLLAALPDVELRRLLPHLEYVEMPLGLVLYESGSVEKNVYFPTSVIISLLYVMINGDAAEIAVIGNEGMVGISLFLGGRSTPSRAVVQSGGRGFRMKAQILKDEFDRAGPVARLLLR